MSSSFVRFGAVASIALGLVAATGASAGVVQYGDQDLCNTGTYPSSPTAGATLEGLAPGDVTYANLITAHGFPFSPQPGDFQGTDQIYVGGNQTGFHDGYSGAGDRLHGPQVIFLDYSSLVPAGHVVTTLTLGIAADDFQNPVFGQPFTAMINGSVNSTITGVLNTVNQTTPVTQFISFGLDVSSAGRGVNPYSIVLSINEGGDGGDGWAIDFLTVGVTTREIPSGATAAPLLAFGALGLRRRR